MTENEYINQYVEFLKEKRRLREKLRDDITDLEINFINTQTVAIKAGLNIKFIQMAVKDLMEQQKHNRKMEHLDTRKMNDLLKEFIDENKVDENA